MTSLYQKGINPIKKKQNKTEPKKKNNCFMLFFGT